MHTYVRLKILIAVFVHFLIFFQTLHVYRVTLAIVNQDNSVLYYELEMGVSLPHPPDVWTAL